MNQKRADIEKKYKWDLSLVLDSDESFLKLIDEVQSRIPELESFRGKLNTKENIINYFKISREIELVLSRVSLYAFLKYEADSLDAENAKMVSRVDSVCVKLSSATSFVQPELSSLDDAFLIALRDDESLKDYDRIFEDILKHKPHTLTPQEEKLVSEMGAFSDVSAVFDMLTDNELAFEPIVDAEGRELPLNHSTYGEYVRSENRDIRRDAHVKHHKAFASINKTLALNYINQLKKSDFFRKTYNYSSTIEMRLFNEEVEKEVYDSLIKSVNKYLKYFYKFVNVKTKILGQSDFEISDVYAPIGNADKYKLSYEDAYSLVEDALSVLGEEYLAVLKKAKTDRWIDVFYNEGKRSGAFSISSETGNPFVMLNYKETYNDISTIAHEMGHAMHSYFSEKHQPHEKCNYVIFVAEIASTVNEILLFKHLLKKETDKETRKFLISSFLENFYATVFRQSMFSEFEYFAHGKINEDEPISFNELNEYYQQLLEKYFGSSCKIHEYAKFEWSRIPHFYRPFYVFKYATGYISALAIVENIERGGKTAVDNYLKFLSGGCSKVPSELLEIAGVDILDESTFEKAFEYYNKMIDELEKLV